MKREKILIVTDAWFPQINGVVTTLDNIIDEGRKRGDIIHVFGPPSCSIKFPLPLYPEIKLSIPSKKKIKFWLECGDYDHIHIATLEGPIGYKFSKICKRMGIDYTASMHTKFPEFVNSKIKWINTKFLWKLMKHRYRDAKKILVPTQSFFSDLVNKHGFERERLAIWSRGVNKNMFKPPQNKIKNTPKILLCVSRISEEKGLDDFCSLTIPNTKKILVGDGPYKKKLEKKYPNVIFPGKKTGMELVEYYQKADVFVFPSKSDTFGIVMIEALACGIPVAGYFKTSAQDVVKHGSTGCLSWNLATSVEHCLGMNDLMKKNILEESDKYTWEKSYEQFKQNLV